jgi:hypothetical protein
MNEKPAQAGFLLAIKLTSNAPAPHNPSVIIMGNIQCHFILSALYFLLPSL